jgi:hypothetical protein
MMVIGQVRDEVLQDLDGEKTEVGHVYELASVEDADV